jgi:rod shape-determining protein MreD
VTIPLLTGIALLQDIVLARVSILGGRPDLVLLSVIAWATLRGSAEGIVWGFIGGLLLDLFSGGPMGGITLPLLVIALLAGRRWGQELGPTGLRVFLVALGLCFLYHVLLLLILTGTGRLVDWAYGLSRVAAPSAVLNGVLAPVVHYLLSILDRRTRPEGLTFDGA